MFLVVCYFVVCTCKVINKILPLQGKSKKFCSQTYILIGFLCLIPNYFVLLHLYDLLEHR